MNNYSVNDYLSIIERRAFRYDEILIKTGSCRFVMASHDKWQVTVTNQTTTQRFSKQLLSYHTVLLSYLKNEELSMSIMGIASQ